MHNDNTILKILRVKHKIHHIEELGIINNNHTALIFTYFETLCVSIITFIPVFIFCYNKNKFFFIFYFLLIFTGIGIHNYCHTKFHKYNNKNNNYIKISVPNFLYKIIKNHHKKHHINPKSNFCVVFLGFDNIIGTNMR